MAKLTGKKFRRATPNIPFFEKGRYYVRLHTETRITDNADFQARAPSLKEEAIDRFMMHYYPEYWPGLAEDLGNIFPDVPEYQDTYEVLRAQLTSQVAVAGYYHSAAPPFDRSYVVASYSPNRGESVDSVRRTIGDGTYAPSQQRIYNQEGELVGFAGLPPMAPVVEYFNSLQEDGGITAPDSQTTFLLTDVLSSADVFAQGFQRFFLQLLTMPANSTPALDLTFFQRDIQKFLSLFVQVLVKQFNSKNDVQDFNEADSLTIYFGTYADKEDKIAISKMEYFVEEESPATQTLAVGYLTNVKYNPLMHDKLGLSLMKNYEDVLEGMQRMQQQPPGIVGNTGYSFLDFVDTVGTGSFMQLGGGQFNFEDNWDQFDFVTPITENAAEEAHQGFIKAAKDAGIPINTQALSDGMEAALTSEQVKELKEKVLENPELAAKVFAEQKAAVLKAGINVSKKLDQLLTQGPLGFVKKNSPLDLVFRQFGVSELAKEAFRCLTLGIAPEMARINQAVQRALTNQAGSIYLPPELPKNEISKPDIDLEMFKPFSLTGDIWKQILKALLDGLRNAVLEIMKELAKLISEACDFNNPYANDYGARDITEFLPQTPGNIYGANPNAAALLNRPMPPDDLYAYLQDLSNILSSLEICLLFTNRDLVSDELSLRIIDYNRTYPHPYVNTQLLTVNAVMAFFANLSEIVDVTSLCDEIVDGAYEINQDNICLTEEDVANAIDAQDIDSLLDLIENGLQLDLPPINFDCPDKEGFISNPLIERSVPQILNFTTEAIELQFINSTEAVLDTLLEPGVVAGSNGGASTKGQATLDIMNKFLPTPQNEEGADLGSAAEDMLQDVMTGFSEFATNLEEALGSPNCAGVPNISALQASFQVLGDVFADPDFVDAITSINDRLGDIAAQITSSDGPGPNNLRATYSFPSNYLSNFTNYIASAPTFNNTTERVEANHYVATSADESLNTGSLATWNPTLADPDAVIVTNIGAGALAYRDLSLTYNFSTIGRKDSLTLSYPRFNTAVAMGGGEDAENLSFAEVQISASGIGTILPPKAEFQISSSVLDVLGSHFYPVATGVDQEMGMRLQTNPYVYRFTGPVATGLQPILQDTTTLEQNLIITEEIETWLYPSLYAGLTKAMFNYIAANGVFDAAGVRALQFFKDNSNCPPQAAADLLDADGILRQVKEEFLESACFDDDIPLDDKIRYAVLLSLFLNLIQIEVAEFVIKNIFAFAAFNVNELMSDPVIAQFMTAQILGDLERRINQQPDMRRAIQEYYNRKMGRAVVASRGGILDHNEAVVFPVGTIFTDANWLELLSYLVNQRIHWGRTAMSNSVRLATPQGQFKKTYNQAFIQDILGFTSLRNPSMDLEPGHNILSRTNGSPLAYGTLALERVVVWDGITGGDAPEALELTRELGGELELSEFRNTFYGGDTSPPYIEGSHNILLPDFDFSFVNLRVKTRLVYFLPSTTNSLDTEFTSQSNNELQGQGTSADIAVESYASLLISRIGHMQDLDQSQNNLFALTEASADALIEDQASLFTYEDGRPVDTPLLYNNVGYVDTPLIRVTIADFEVENDQWDAFLPDSAFELLRDQLDDWLATGPLTIQQQNARNAEVTRIANNPVYKQIFGETFIQSFITMVPMYQNFYLTERYFEQIDQTYGATKAFIVNAFLDVLYNREEQEDPGNDRAAARAAIQNTQGPEFAATMQSMGRDFILKMLIETPIMILKGLAEMIDPHVAIWKVVRNITGTAFSEIIKVIDAAPPLAELKEQTGLEITGEQLLGVMLCLVEFGMQSGLEAAISASPPPLNNAANNEELINNILPKFTLDGVDFTGTLTGMIMLPPLPFGVLYILLELAKKAIEDDLDGEETEVSGEESLPEC
tara:strand:- start:84373 stop:90009 length:5637 start_codon:yes stop_codon:yes gene_type:complete